MKVTKEKVKLTPPPFEPVRIIIELETRDEAHLFGHLVGGCGDPKVLCDRREEVNALAAKISIETKLLFD